MSHKNHPTNTKNVCVRHKNKLSEKQASKQEEEEEMAFELKNRIFYNYPWDSLDSTVNVEPCNK